MAGKMTEAVEKMLRSVFAITAEGTSQSESGYGAPYGPPFFIVDTSTAEPEVNWPGELIEQVDDIGEVGKRLHAARVAVATAVLERELGLEVEEIAESIWQTTLDAICDAPEPSGRTALEDKHG